MVYCAQCRESGANSVLWTERVPAEVRPWIGEANCSADGGKKGRGSSAVPGTTGRPAEVLREASGIKSMGERAMGSQ
jgi:hypothetical protein